MSSESLPFRRIKARPTTAVSHNPWDSPLTFQTPRLISDVSAWVQHIPFAFSLIEMMRPKRVVELGTFKGDSYCAFCQAVDMLQLETECTAVDTWAGDAQSGIYDEGVFQELSAYHDPLYGGFSTLLRASFDEASGRFADGSIDLLHIDGLHNYAAVRHDFETWRPKLSDAAVVLMHDIDVRHGDFGVYRLWEELRPHYPHFEFLHGYGLGVLLVGRHVPERVEHFVTAANKSPETVRRCFHALGQRLELGRGVALLAEDVARQEAKANEWRSLRKQPQRDLLPEDLAVGAFLDEVHCDVKRHIDRIHEASINHLDDMRTIAVDNKNLSDQVEELGMLAGSLRRLEGERLEDREALRKHAGSIRILEEERLQNREELGTLVGSIRTMEEERAHNRQELASLRDEFSRFSATLVTVRQEVLRLQQLAEKKPPPSRVQTLLQNIRAFLESHWE